MKKSVCFVFAILISVFVSAQITIRENQTTTSDKVLILENHSTGKSYRFYPDNRISLKTKDNHKKIAGRISEILDSSFILSHYNEIELRNITVVYTDRIGIRIVASTLALFGVLFFTVDALNNVINNDHPKIRSDVGIISGSSLAAAGLLWLFSERKCPVKPDKWRLKIIDQIHVKSK
jgi:hypothetical protein